ncbi:MAG: hypothetical protein AVDCRST_MAG29-1032, partial [uncultured Nocardioidaceae bacterium]
GAPRRDRAAAPSDRHRLLAGPLRSRSGHGGPALRPAHLRLLAAWPARLHRGGAAADRVRREYRRHARTRDHGAGRQHRRAAGRRGGRCLLRRTPRAAPGAGRRPRQHRQRRLSHRRRAQHLRTRTGTAAAGLRPGHRGTARAGAPGSGAAQRARGAAHVVHPALRRRGHRGTERSGGYPDRGHRCARRAAVRVRVVPGTAAAADRGGVDPDHLPDRAGPDHLHRRELRGAVPDLAGGTRRGHRLLTAPGDALARGAGARPRQPRRRGDSHAHRRRGGPGLRSDSGHQPDRPAGAAGPFPAQHGYRRHAYSAGQRVGGADSAAGAPRERRSPHRLAEDPARRRARPRLVPVGAPDHATPDRGEPGSVRGAGSAHRARRGPQDRTVRHRLAGHLRAALRRARDADHRRRGHRGAHPDRPARGPHGCRSGRERGGIGGRHPCRRGGFRGRWQHRRAGPARRGDGRQHRYGRRGGRACERGGCRGRHRRHHRRGSNSSRLLRSRLRQLPVRPGAHRGHHVHPAGPHLPVAAAAAEGGAAEPDLTGGGLRRGGLLLAARERVRRHLRRLRDRRCHVLAAGDHLRVPVRPVDGLRGLHPGPDARGVRRVGQHHRRRGERPRTHGPPGDVGRPDPVLLVRCPGECAGYRHQGARDSAGRRDPDRRHHRAGPAGACPRRPSRPVELVAAGRRGAGAAGRALPAGRTAGTAPRRHAL